MRSKRDRHVVPNGHGGWAVRQSGASKASRTFETEKEAVTYARDSARKGGADLYIHGRDGTVRSKDSFGADPYPPREKRS